MLDQVTIEDQMEQEGVLKECKGLLIKSKVNVLDSKIFLTPNRFVVKSVSRNKAALFGLIGAIIVAIKGKKYPVLQLNLELKDIDEAKQGKFGLNKHVLEITTKNSESYRIVVDNYPDWQKALDNKMNQKS